MKVLLVDDEPVLRRSLSRIMGRMGIEVLAAGDGDEALALSDHELALALVDVKLPGMSGIDVIKRLRERHPQLPAILMTGELRGDLPKNLGTDVVVLDKPFDKDTLRSVLKQLIKVD